MKDTRSNLKIDFFIYPIVIFTATGQSGSSLTNEKKKRYLSLFFNAYSSCQKSTATYEPVSILILNVMDILTCGHRHKLFTQEL